MPPVHRGGLTAVQRICGELKKLGIKLSKSCVSDILRRNNLPPSPERKGLTWREFLARHADVLLCADLFTKETWTFCSLRRAFVLVVMHLKGLRPTLAVYRRHFNKSRPHQGLANRVPRAIRTGEPAPEVVSGLIGTVYCEESLGGLLKSYRRAA